MKIYHNPKCGKSRAALKFLLDKGFQPEVVEYLKYPPSATELKAILKLANLKALDIIRKKEDLFISNYKDKDLSDDEWINIMIEHPILIERPIIVIGDKVVIGRTEESLQEIIA